jgi:predicted CopG family antitoxin
MPCSVYGQCMAVPTLTLDTDAYELLARAKQPGQLFSTVITQHFRPRKTAAALVRALPSFKLKEETLDQIEAQVTERRCHPAGLPPL